MHVILLSIGARGVNCRRGSEVGTVNSDTRQLIVDVMDGNPGALTIIRKLMEFPTWYQLLHHLKSQGVVGGALWQVVKDNYGHDLERFVNDQLGQMRPERAQTLRTLKLNPSYRNN
jgi:hypothetical protein